MRMFLIILLLFSLCEFFFFQAEDGIRAAQESRGLGDVYKRQQLQPFTVGMKLRGQLLLLIILEKNQ